MITAHEDEFAVSGWVVVGKADVQLLETACTVLLNGAAQRCLLPARLHLQPRALLPPRA